MARNQAQQKVRACTRQPGLGRMLLLSFGLHLAVVFIFAVGILPQPRRPLQPVYYVDLVNPPVKNPQAGRPDARPEPAKKPESAPAPRPEPPKPETKPQPKPPTRKPEPKPVKPVPAKPLTKEPPKADAKPAKKIADEKALEEKLRQMQARQEMEDLKRKLAQMGSQDTRAGAVDTPVGMPTGKGTQAGIDEQEWISAFIKQNWNLSKYQVKRRDVWARTRLIFDPRGALLDYKFLRESGDATFDDSVKKAILKARQLPFQPERRLEIEVEFNLKDVE